ncbi:SGNH/GDSL hydrolase family protein [Planococcus lenghuensis]|uniref:GDSL family lipase n=1 Tax=Planococcus lenghuensis TaxID=2213202 RepID=A0A1Q2KYW9_9BACL|nr:GDSL-type esterase/lipase family protein [Planococcus lenghuensis]AQQ53410.1 GDSL family lipase [Planococcus lenghuensis]
MKIVCFGDSLTRGVTFRNERFKILKSNYPAMLQELLNNNESLLSGSEAHVLNKGAFNDNSNSLLARLEKDVVAEQPAIVIIGIGGNDCNFLWEEVADHPDDTHQAIVPLDRYRKNISSIVTHVKQHGITPIILTLPPLDPVRYYENIIQRFSSRVSNWICKAGGIEHWHGQYNRSVTEVAAESGVLKIDVRSALRQAGDLVSLVSADGIHLTAEGYKVLGTEIYHNISSILANDDSQSIPLF